MVIEYILGVCWVIGPEIEVAIVVDKEGGLICFEVFGVVVWFRGRPGEDALKVVDCT